MSMETDQRPDPGLAQAIQEVSDRAAVLIREEIELAKAEVSAKVTSLAKGVAIGAAAGGFVMGALILILHGFAWLMYEVMPTPEGDIFWGFFIAAGILLLLSAVIGYVAYRFVNKGKHPAPQMAIDEARLIKETVKHP